MSNKELLGVALFGMFLSTCVIVFSGDETLISLKAILLVVHTTFAWINWEDLKKEKRK